MSTILEAMCEEEKYWRRRSESPTQRAEFVWSCEEKMVLFSFNHKLFGLVVTNPEKATTTTKQPQTFWVGSN